MTSKKNNIYSEEINDFKCPSNLPITGVLPPVDRILVIGDVHGDIDALRNNLKIAGVIEIINNTTDKFIGESDKWTGKGTVIVQLGDIIDSCRGDDCIITSSKDKGADFDLLKYMVKLNDKAMNDPNHGAVYSLIGNHEIMNVMGNFNYVSPNNFDKFADLFNDTDINKYEARKKAFQPGQPIANFLACSKVGALIIGSNLFVHGGITPELADNFSDISKINKILQKWLLNKLENTELNKKILFDSQYSPFWNRLLGKMKSNLSKQNAECIKNVNPILKTYKVGKIFIGHTPKQNIDITCDNSLYRVDTALSHAFDKYKTPLGKHNSMVEILNDTEIKIIN